MRKHKYLAINLRPRGAMDVDRIHRLRHILGLMAEQDMTTISQAVARLIEQEGHRRGIIKTNELRETIK